MYPLNDEPLCLTDRSAQNAAAPERLMTVNVNGQTRRVDVTANETLAMTLRYKLGLAGTKLGCDRGACTVLIDDVPHHSCSTLTHSLRARKVTTIEGLEGPNGELHPMQKAFVEELAPQCGFCDAKITRGYRLPARHVIHAVGPVWSRKREEECDQLLASCYRASLALAAQHGITSVAFPSISTGVYAFPPNRAARIAVRTVMAELDPPSGVQHVVFCCFSGDAARHHEDAFWALGLG